MILLKIRIFAQNKNMSAQTQNPEDFYKRLKAKLEENTIFPTEYLYKFILPAQEEKIAELYSVFDGIQTEISTKDSSSGKYVSFSIKLFVENADQVIDFYKKASKIEGIVSL